MPRSKKLSKKLIKKSSKFLILFFLLLVISAVVYFVTMSNNTFDLRKKAATITSCSQIKLSGDCRKVLGCEWKAVTTKENCGNPVNGACPPGCNIEVTTVSKPCYEFTNKYSCAAKTGCSSIIKSYNTTTNKIPHNCISADCSNNLHPGDCAWSYTSTPKYVCLRNYMVISATSSSQCSSMGGTWTQQGTTTTKECTGTWYEYITKKTPVYACIGTYKTNLTTCKTSVTKTQCVGTPSQYQVGTTCSNGTKSGSCQKLETCENVSGTHTSAEQGVCGKNLVCCFPPQVGSLCRFESQNGTCQQRSNCSGAKSDVSQGICGSSMICCVTNCRENGITGTCKGLSQCGANAMPSHFCEKYYAVDSVCCPLTLPTPPTSPKP